MTYVTLLHKGNEIEVEGNITPLFKKGEFLATRGIFRDVTERNRAEKLLASLNKAAHAVQKSLGSGDVFEAIGTELKKFGFQVAIHLLDDDKNLRIKYISFSPKLIKAVEKLIGLRLEEFKYPLDNVESYKHFCRNKKTIFLSPEKNREAIRLFLPRSLRKYSNKIINILSINQAIVAPLIIKDKIIGILIVNSSNLDESYIPAITTFANETSIALENEQLFREMQLQMTEREKAEGNLRKSEERYRLMFETTPSPTVTVNMKGVVLSCNKAALNMIGCKKNEMVSKHFSKLKFIYLKDIPKYLRILASLVRGKVPDSFELPFIRKDGTSGMCGVSVCLFKDMSGKKRILAVAIDITERKKAEEALQKSAIIINSTNDAIIGTDLKGNITSYNKGAQMMYGYTAKEMIGKPVAIICLAEDFPKLAKIMKDLSKGKIISSIEMTTKCKNKKLLPITLSLAPIRDEKRKIIEFIGIAKDITELKRLQKKEREAEKIKIKGLERFTKLAVGRELEMIKLKKMIKELESKLKSDR